MAAQFFASHLEKSHSLLPASKPTSIYPCDICKCSLSKNHIDIALCPHESCASLFHLTCLATRLEGPDSILPIKGTCPVCQRNILWGDVIRGVFGRSGQMETVNPDEDELEDTQDEDEDDEAPAASRRRKRVSGLVTLTGKQKTPQKTTPKKPRTPQKSSKTRTTGRAMEIPASDEDESTPRPPKPRGRPKASKPQPSKLPERPAEGFVVPDSAGEERDVWVISSGEE